VPIRDNDDLFLNIGIHLAGQPIRLVVARSADGPRRTVTANLAKFYVPGPIIASRRPAAPCGLRVDHTSILSQRNAFPALRHIPHGVVIREVLPNSPADKAQLQPDKVITRVNGKVINTPSEFYAAMDRAGGPIELRIQDGEGREERVSLEKR
jgi:S1-C subfamily serine protease